MLSFFSAGLDSGVIYGLGMFAGLLTLIMLGIPVVFALAGTAMLFSAIGLFTGALSPALFFALPTRIYGIIWNDALLAIPFFVAMGVLLERSGLAEDLLETSAALLAKRKAGLAIAVTLAGALLAATTGVVGATVTAMGMVALPVMLRHGYAPSFAAGTIAAAGTLGQIIPPSIVLVVLADQLGAAHHAAEVARGNFAPEPITISQLFAGAIVPGLLLVSLYILWQFIFAMRNPALCPPVQLNAMRPSLSRVLRAFLPPLLLVMAVLGALLFGLATSTEAASLGACAALLLAYLKKRKAGHFWPLLRGALFETATVSGMIFAILIGATFYSLVFRGLGAEAMVEAAFNHAPGGARGAMAMTMLIVFILGFFIDFLEICFVIVPLLAPVLFTKFAIDPLWFGIMMGVNLQTSFLTPPFGPSLFYLRAVAPPEVTTARIYRGIIPFVILQLVALSAVWFWPELATALPKFLYR